MRSLIASGVIYAVLTLAIGREVAASLGTAVAHDQGDSLLNAAVLAWSAQHVPLSDAWFQFPSFYPARDTLLFAEHLLGVSIVATPIYWVTGNPLVTYNLTLLLSFPLSALAMYALVWRLTRSAPAAFVAGAMFGFTPYRLAHLWHLQLLASWWAPLSLLGLHAYIETRRYRWLALFAVAWMLQGAASGYLLFYFSIVVGLWVLWFVIARRRWRALGEIAAAAAVASVPLVPIMLRYLGVQERYGFMRSPEEVLYYEADIAGALCAPLESAVWSHLRVACGAESELFPGIVLSVLAVAAVVWLVREAWRSRRFHAAWQDLAIPAFYILAAIATWIFSWGPEPRAFGRPVLPAGPFAWLMYLPGMQGLRVPARFWLLTLMCLTVLAGLVVARMMARAALRTRIVAMVVLAIGLGLDAWTTIGVVPGPSVAPRPDLLRGGLTLELPIGDVAQDAGAQFRAAAGGWRTVNGYGGYQPAQYPALRKASAWDSDDLFPAFTREHDLDVLVSTREPRLFAVVERQPGMAMVGRNSQFVQYRLPKRGARVSAALGQRRRVEAISVSCEPQIAANMTDGNRATRWQCGPQKPGQQITADLGSTVSVGAVVPALGAFPTDFPRHLLVETSTDGALWTPGWNDVVAGATIDAALEDALAVRVRISFEPRDARYVRLTQLGSDDAQFWSIAELEIWSGSAAP